MSPTSVPRGRQRSSAGDSHSRAKDGRSVPRYQRCTGASKICVPGSNHAILRRCAHSPGRDRGQAVGAAGSEAARK